MNWLDIFLLIYLFFEAWKGFKNGLMNELGSILGIILGFLLASITNESLAVFFSPVTGGSLWMSRIVAFLLTFLAVFSLILILSKIFEGFLKVFALNWLNQIAGAFFNVMKGLLVISVIVNLLLFIDFRSRLIPNHVKEKSLMFEKVSKIAPAVFPTVQIFKHTAEPDDTK